MKRLLLFVIIATVCGGCSVSVNSDDPVVVVIASPTPTATSVPEIVIVGKLILENPADVERDENGCGQKGRMVMVGELSPFPVTDGSTGPQVGTGIFTDSMYWTDGHCTLDWRATVQLGPVDYVMTFYLHDNWFHVPAGEALAPGSHFEFRYNSGAELIDLTATYESALATRTAIAEATP